MKIQSSYISPSELSRQDVEQFRQTVLERYGKRDYALVTLLAYAGLRISEALNLEMDDVNLITKEIVIHMGKGAIFICEQKK